MFISQLLASGVGGSIGGSFVPWGVNAQFRQQSESALRALRVEVDGNFKAANDMVWATSSAGTVRSPFTGGKPDPSWLKRSIWDSQLPYLVRLLDEDAVQQTASAYATLEVVSQIPKGVPLSVGYAHGGWIDLEIIKIRDSFTEAQRALQATENRLSKRWTKHIRRLFEKVKTRLHLS